MTDIRVKPLSAQHAFDKESFQRLCRTDMISTKDTAMLGRFWDRWTGNVGVFRIDVENGGRLLVWLGRDVELDVERTWMASPSRGYLVHSLAVQFVLSTASALVPEIAELGCAPVPEPCEGVSAVVAKLGLYYKQENSLNRRYSLMTHLPGKGGCESCWLFDNCPRKDVWPA